MDWILDGIKKALALVAGRVGSLHVGESSSSNGFQKWILGIVAAVAVMGTTTLAQFITEWAPPSENDTVAYIQAVSAMSGIDPNAAFDLHASLPALAEAMIFHENGQQPYGADDLALWVYLA